jgi:chromosome segregation ATPase
MKRAVEYIAVDDNGAPLKKHGDDPDIRIAHIRHEIVVEQQAITALHSSIAALHTDLDKQQQRLATLERELDDAYKARDGSFGKGGKRRALHATYHHDCDN